MEIRNLCRESQSASRQLVTRDTQLDGFGDTIIPAGVIGGVRVFDKTKRRDLKKSFEKV